LRKWIWWFLSWLKWGPVAVLNDFDTVRARKDTGACPEIVHFNNTGAALMPVPVSEVLHGYRYEEERLGGYEAKARHGEVLRRVITMS
jgi:hypothetical protein